MNRTCYESMPPVFLIRPRGPITSARDLSTRESLSPGIVTSDP